MQTFLLAETLSDEEQTAEPGTQGRQPDRQAKACQSPETSPGREAPGPGLGRQASR